MRLPTYGGSVSYLQLCNIAPTAVLEKVITRNEKWHLVVADVIVADPIYCAFYVNRVDKGEFVILDSAAFEKPNGTDIPTMEMAIRMLRPTEVVLPDLPSDMHESIRRTREALNLFRVTLGYKPKFMAVPHGRSLEEYLWCAADVGFLTGVTTIGIQEEVEELYGMSRSEVAQKVRGTVGGREIHLLGCREDLSDVRDEWVRSTVRSCDTGKLVTWGLNGILIDPSKEEVPPYPGRQALGGREGYFSYASTDPANVVKAARNVVAMRQYLHPETKRGE